MGKIDLTFSKNLKLFREKAKLTQSELAKKAGINRSHLALIETNGKVNSSLKTLEKLAKALGVSASELLSEKFKTRK